MIHLNLTTDEGSDIYEAIAKLWVREGTALHELAGVLKHRLDNPYVEAEGKSSWPAPWNSMNHTDRMSHIEVAGVNAAKQQARIRVLEHELETTTAMLVLDDRLKDMTECELAIMQEFAAKLLGEGRGEHGRMDLANDDRDLLGEAADELGDTIAYLLMEQRRLWLRRERA